MKKGDILIPPYSLALNCCPFCKEVNKTLFANQWDCGYEGYWQYDQFGNLTGACEVISPCLHYGKITQSVPVLGWPVEYKASETIQVDMKEPHKCYCDRDAVINFGCKCGGI